MSRYQIYDMKLRYIISEIFDNPLHIKWIEKSKDWVGHFIVNRKKYVISILDMREEWPCWEIKFELKDKGRSVGGRQDITNTGDAATVFSTVVSGIKEWIAAVNPASFSMSAREPNRQRLYRRMLRMLPKKVWDIDDFGTTFFAHNKSIPREFDQRDDPDYDDYYDDDPPPY